MKGARASRSGVTLVELVAAVVISALVVALASRVFLSGQKEFLARVFETDRLSDLVRLKGVLHRALGGRIERCEGGKMALATDSAALDLNGWIKTRFPEADSLVFRCLEADVARGELTEWKGRFQPRLVEYRACLKMRGRAECLVGSVLK